MIVADAHRDAAQRQGGIRLPSGWRWVNLGSMCRPDRKTVEPGSNLAARLPYLGLEHVEGGTGRILKEPSEAAIDEGRSTTFAFDARHVLYGKLRPYLNKVALPLHAGRCTTEIIPLLPEPGIDRGFLAWLLRRQETVEAAMREKNGSRMPRADVNELLKVLVPRPPEPEQRRIAALLAEQIAAVERARHAVEAQLTAATELDDAYFREAFQGVVPLAASDDHEPAPPGWKWELLTGVARLESGHTPSRYHPEWWGGNIPWLALPDIRAVDGQVVTETSEYINEDGIANSSARVLPAGTVALSRTASVGFVTIFGRPMATSQDFANWVCGPSLLPEFLAFVLRASRQSIRDLSSGAVHKTVYMPAIKAFRVCVPKHDEDQQRIVAPLRARLQEAERLRSSLEAQRNAIANLPALLLTRAFSGELSAQPATGISAVPGVDLGRQRSALAAHIVQRLHTRNTFGRVQLAKVIFLSEAHVGVALEGHYKREAAGPLDSPALYAAEDYAYRHDWFSRHPRGAEGHYYRPGPAIAGALDEAAALLGDRRAELDRLLALFADLYTEEAEIVATLYAAWNDLLIDGRQPTDELIVREVRENWHERKRRFALEELIRWLGWLRAHHLTPRGTGPRTTEETNARQ